MNESWAGKVGRVVLLLAVAAAAWSITLNLRGTPPQIGLSDPQFSTEIQLVGQYDHDAVYVVEQRAAPDRRVMRLDPRTGEITTIRSMSNDEQVNGMALHPGGDVLAIGWTPDVALRGNGFALMNVATGEVDVIVDVVADRFLFDPVWDADGSTVHAAQVITTGGLPAWSIVQIDTDRRTIVTLVNDALGPAIGAAGLYFLEPDVDGNGRAIGLLGPDGQIVPVAQAEAPMTIDHLMVGADGTSLSVATHLQQGARFSFGAPADAHVGPSTWWTLDPASGSAMATNLPADTALDAVITSDGTLVYITRDGLWFARQERVQVAGSRALRFVTG
ncbi:MAG: hypothetical protein ACI867_001029 [Glaciecola sp.]|jgi:hypothetical protein